MAGLIDHPTYPHRLRVSKLVFFFCLESSRRYRRSTMLLDHEWFLHALRPFLAPRTHHALGLASRLYWETYTKKETTICVFANERGGWRKERPPLFRPGDVEALFIRLPDLRDQTAAHEIEKLNSLFRRVKRQVLDYWVPLHPKLCDIEIRWRPKTKLGSPRWFHLLMDHRRWVQKMTESLMPHGFEPYKHAYTDRALWVR